VVVGQHFATSRGSDSDGRLAMRRNRRASQFVKLLPMKQQVVVLELVEELFRRQVLALQRADELERVLVARSRRWATRTGARAGGRPRPLNASRSRGKSATRFGA
jgi:hypothetical protein